jgi:branched-chain amino acid transport system ATP-binding protein
MTQPLLKVTGLDASYGVLPVLRDINFEVAAGEVVVILGANGAGKTTTLRAICGMVSTSGSVQIDGVEMSKKDTADIVRSGLAHVPQGRGTFPELSVIDNLMLGAYVRRDNEVSDIERWICLPPAT